MSESSPASQLSPPTKRKRDTATEDELEIDLALPEPLSRKDKRKAKKIKPTKSETSINQTSTENTTTQSPTDHSTTDTQPTPNSTTTDTASKPKRTPYSIWIGNLPWTLDRAALKTFITTQTSLAPSSLVRVHLPPAPPSAAAAAAGRSRSASTTPKNAGFAYVDFASAAARDAALALSEELCQGRRVLVKDAGDFGGRPAGSARGSGANAEALGAAGESGRQEKPASRRVFVGNLPFDVTRESLGAHFGVCGAVLDVHVATFEDSGKCKGYGWVTFETEESARAAVVGYVLRTPDKDEEKDGDEDENENEGEESRSKKSKSQSQSEEKSRKQWVNRMSGRQLKCEYAEDASVRYKKRFGGKKKDDQQISQGIEETSQTNGATAHDRRRMMRKSQKNDQNKTNIRLPPMSRLPQVTGAIATSTGSKKTFD